MFNNFFQYCSYRIGSGEELLEGDREAEEDRRRMRIFEK